jgi:protease-4
MRLLGRVLVVILAVIGGGVLLFGGIAGWSALHSKPTPLPSKMVISLDLDQGVTETHGNGIFPFERRKGYALTEIIEMLDRASRDARVTGLVARFDAPAMGMAQVQEVRDAIAAFRHSGKRVVAYSTSLGGFGGGSLAYYLASGFHDIWLQPSGDIGLTGYRVESPFVKNLLDMLSIKAEFGGRYEYKTAIETFTHDKYSKEGRESLQLLVDSWTRQTVEGIAQARGLPPADVRAITDRAPLMAEEALQAKLIDKLAYWDELEKDLTADGAKLVDLNDYASRAKGETTAVKVALIAGIGEVQEGDNGDSLLERSSLMSSRRLEKSFKDAVADPDIKAILFRIDSPGGAYPAADAIWRAVSNARAANKPVIVSMGNVAASGGYYGAMAADKIVAQPGTITGSIGVFAGKLALTDFWKKIGISWDEVHQGKNSGMWSANNSFTPAQWERVNAMLDHTYADFTGKAEAARHITPEAMDKLARGRIWPGDEAKRLGLVDELGGYPEAFILIRQLAKQPSQMPVELVPFPKEKSPVELLLEFAKSGQLSDEVSSEAVALGKVMRLIHVFAPVAEMVDGADQSLKMPVVTAR